MQKNRFEQVSLEELPKVAKAIVEITGGNKLLAFYGELGVGKTTLIKEICKVLGVKEEVSSPTFSLVNEYLTTNEESVYHFDFYRIKDEEEALDIGIEEYFYSSNYCLVEWPEKIPNLLVDRFVKIKINLEGTNRAVELITQ